MASQERFSVCVFVLFFVLVSRFWCKTKRNHLNEPFFGLIVVWRLERGKMFKKTKKTEGSKGPKVGGDAARSPRVPDQSDAAARLRKTEQIIVTTKDKEEVIDFLGRVQKKREEEGEKGRSLVDKVSVDTFPSGLTDGLGLFIRLSSLFLFPRIRCSPPLL